MLLPWGHGLMAAAGFSHAACLADADSKHAQHIPWLHAAAAPVGWLASLPCLLRPYVLAGCGEFSDRQAPHVGRDCVPCKAELALLCSSSQVLLLAFDAVQSGECCRILLECPAAC